MMFIIVLLSIDSNIDMSSPISRYPTLTFTHLSTSAVYTANFPVAGLTLMQDKTCGYTQQGLPHGLLTSYLSSNLPTGFDFTHTGLTIQV